jgi:steroid 5-alpha reductase family enzyme
MVAPPELFLRGPGLARNRLIAGYWLTYPLIAIDLTGQYPFGFLALAGPACMYWLLVYVSGIPPLEEHMLRSRGEAFRAYQHRTNAFFPGPPRQ